MAEAARMVEASGADLVDLNFGSLVRKVTKTGAGATLLDDPVRARIVEAIADAVDLPVSVKPPRAAGRLARLPRGGAAARRGGRVVAHAPSALRPADVQGDG